MILDPETEIVNTIGAKEGLSHLMWVLSGPGDSVLVPSPSYPIHIFAPLFADYPREVSPIYEGRRNALCDGLDRIGWSIHRPRGTMFAWAEIPEAYRGLGSIVFASHLVREARVATSPGVGFGPGGEGFVRFALIENEQRIGQAVRNLRRALPELG